MEWIVNSSEPTYDYTTETDEVVREKYSARIIALVKTKANAQLIAKSPRMIELLERVIVEQAGWLNQSDIDEGKKILAR